MVVKTAPGIIYLSLFIITAQSLLLAAAMDKEDCELYAPSTMHEFCCDIHDENAEFFDCEIEWSDKIHHTNDEQELSYNFCVSECVYNKTDYLGSDRKSLRMNVIKHHLSELHDDEDSEQLLYNTFLKCAKHATEMLQHETIKKLEKRLAKYSCHPYPGLVFECVSNELILNCPPKKYHSTAQCDHAKEYLETCLIHKI